MNNKFFCQYCPCVWCDGNEKGNTEATGYPFIPDPDHCKEMFKKEPEITWNTFLQAIFELHGSSVNDDWKRFGDDDE